MTTLKITVNYTVATEQFSFTPSYLDSSTSTTYTGSNIADGDTLAFINDGQYTLTSPSTLTQTYDDVDVVLSAELSGQASKICGLGRPFDLSNIEFPTIPAGAASTTTGYQWCQEVPSAAQDSTSTRFVDPKLGLSNSKGGTEGNEASFGTCDCSS